MTNINWQSYNNLNAKQKASAKRLVAAAHKMEIQSFGKILSDVPIEQCKFQLLKNGRVSHEHFMTR